MKTVGQYVVAWLLAALPSICNAQSVNDSSELYPGERVLSQGGLTFDDVSRVNLSLADIVAAFGSKRIEAGWEVEPLISAGCVDVAALLIQPGTDGVDTVWVESGLRSRFALEPAAEPLFRVVYF